MNSFKADNISGAFLLEFTGQTTTCCGLDVIYRLKVVHHQSV